ncbi:hypothetical protein TIFTF001_012876 [Ficus carica]|uniref:Uncharacterized protein n=1 Tax=Ficus carica TaxID=3494 RepID=A0AA88AGS2_FICCA|nr:hypothetical protein TIFTF001_012876 [Ficus carica]
MAAEMQWKVGDPDWPTSGEGGLAVAKTQGSEGPRFAKGLATWGKKVWVDGEDARRAARSVFGTGAELGDGENAEGAKLGDDEGGRQIMWVGERGGYEFSSISLFF